MYRPHRAWAVCAGGAIMLFISMGLAVNVFSVYLPYIIDCNAFTNAQGSWITTTRSLFVLAGMATAPRLCGRIGLRRTSTFAMGLVVLSYILFGLAWSFPVYCGAAALSGLGYSWGGMIPLSLLINRWFQMRQGFALGLASAGSGVATILMPTPLTWLIETWGLSAAFWCEAALILMLTILACLLIRERPEELGLSPYSQGRQEAASTPASTAPAAMTPGRWRLVLLAVFLLGGPTSLGVSHLGVLYSTEGCAPELVAALISCMGLCLMGGKMLYGALADRLGGRRSNYIIYGVSLLAYALCCLAPLGGVLLPFGAMVALGLSLAVSNVSLSVWAKDLCGDAGFTRGLKWCQIMYALGILVVGPVPGILADAAGSYVPAYFLFLLMMLVSMLLMCWVYGRTQAGGPPDRS